ncbi:MAG TPA: 50S ribosomal protein L11 methyltransferase [Solirubrobacteraceae bacterium]|nr:50S ribosomal protein L11 methyltransferase [Solirubrobacteraceae bacterium]
MRRVVASVRERDLEEVYDRLLPLVAGGVHERERPEGVRELAWVATPETEPEALRDLLGARLLRAEGAEVAPGDVVAETGHAWTIGDRLVLRTPDAPAAPPGLAEVVVERPPGTFGSGQHPTTRACLALLVELPAEGELADLGCGTGVLAVAAARLGFAPVFAIDHEPASVAATIRNAERNEVRVAAAQADLLAADPPPARTIAANVPLAVHQRLAAALPGEVRRLIASGLEPAHAVAAEPAYAAAGLRVARRIEDAGWVTLLLERDPA